MSTYVLRAGTLIDATGAAPRSAMDVIVEDDRIAAIVPSADHEIPADAEVVDLGGMTLLPGLIDCHEHLGLIFGEDEAEQGTDAPEYYAMKSLLHTQQILDAGVTTVRTAGDPGDTGNLIKRALSHGIIHGPTIVSAHRLITRTGGHAWFIANQADGPWGLRSAIREEVRRGADVIKITVSGGAATIGSDVYAPDMTTEEIEACVDEAHRLGRRIMAHGHGGAGITQAVRAGVDSIEHGMLLTPDDLDLMKEHDTYLVATSVYGIEALKNPSVPEYVKEKVRGSVATSLDALRYAAEIGVKVAVGTDTLHGRVWEELAVLAENGFTPMQALQAGTRNGADLIGVLEEKGTIEPGKVADLIAVRGNPLDDLAALDRPPFIMHNGRVHRLPA